MLNAPPKLPGKGLGFMVTPASSFSTFPQDANRRVFYCGCHLLSRVAHPCQAQIACLPVGFFRWLVRTHPPFSLSQAQRPLGGVG